MGNEINLRYALRTKANATEVRRLQQQIAKLNDALVKVNDKQRRAIVQVDNLVANTNTDVAVTWSTSFPDTTYGVQHSIVSGGLALGTLSCTLKTKAVDGCLLTVRGTQAVVQFFVEVWALRSA